MLGDARRERRRGIGHERAAAGQHLVEHRAEGEQVGSRIDFAAELLGRHVRQGALGCAAADWRRHRHVHRVTSAAQTGDAEVEELDARRREHDVPGLDVVVNDAVLVRECEAVGHRGRDAQRLTNRQAASVPGEQARGEGLALESFHHQAGPLVSLDDVVQAADVGVRERRQDPGLALYPRAPSRIVPGAVPEGLDRDRSIEAGIARTIHLALASGAERSEDLVGTEPGSAG